jgi:hypothetical protein
MHVNIVIFGIVTLLFTAFFLEGENSRPNMKIRMPVLIVDTGLGFNEPSDLERRKAFDWNRNENPQKPFV